MTNTDDWDDADSEELDDYYENEGDNASDNDDWLADPDYDFSKN